MDESNNMSQDDTRVDEETMEENEPENVKRAKTENNSPDKSESSEEKVSTSSNTEPETASTSTSSGFSKSRNRKNRNYRKSCDDESNGSSNGESNGEERESEPEQNRQRCDSDIIEALTEGDFEVSSWTSVHDTDSDDSTEPEEHPVLKKEQPKHNWFIVPEILNRQLGNRANIQNNIHFQKRCYGSLHCVQRLELMYKLEQHEGCVNSLNFHPDGSLLASGSDDLKVVLWDWKIGKSLLSFDTKHRGNVFQSKFLPLSGDLHIATCARDGQVSLRCIFCCFLR